MTELENIRISESNDITITFPDPNTKAPGNKIIVDFVSGQYVFTCIRVKEGSIDYNVWSDQKDSPATS